MGSAQGSKARNNHTQESNASLPITLLKMRHASVPLATLIIWQMSKKNKEKKYLQPITQLTQTVTICRIISNKRYNKRTKLHQ